MCTPLYPSFQPKTKLYRILEEVKRMAKGAFLCRNSLQKEIHKLKTEVMLCINSKTPLFNTEPKSVN